MSETFTDYRDVHSRPFQDCCECVSRNIGREIHFQSCHFCNPFQVGVDMTDYLMDTVANLLFALMDMPVEYRKDIIIWTCV